MDFQAAYSVVDDDTTTAEAFRILDEEVNKHRDFILSLQTRRNAFAPISKLPPELLGRIFGFLSQAPPDYSTTVLSWIKISYVCRTWRNIALNHPSLWSVLPLGYRRWTKEMLDRSKMASLTIDVDSAGSSYRRTLRDTTSLALSHSSRIQSLCLLNIDHDIMQKWLSDMPKFTPRLESIRLSVVRRSLDPLLEPGCDLPPELLSTTDGLRRFEVTRFKFNWELLLSESLTHVKIHDVPPSARPTRLQLWSVLQKMPLLESLELCNAFPDSDTPLPSDSPYHPIHLSRLQSITVNATTSQILGLLQYLSFPPTTNVDIDCKGTNATKFDFTGITSWAATFLATPKKTRGSIRSLDIRSSFPMPGVIFRAFSEVMSDDEYTKPGVHPKFRMSLTSGSAPDIDVNKMDKILVDVFGALPLQGIVALRLEQTRSFFSSRTLTQTFGTLTQLRSVAAVGPVAKVLVGALKESLPNRRSTRSHHNQVSFPALRSISLCSVDLENDVSLGSLEAAIKSRKKRGVEVRELKLEECSRVTQEDVAGLEEAVPTFKWDGIELGFTDEEEDEDYYGDPMDYDDDFGYDSDDVYNFYVPF